MGETEGKPENYHTVTYELAEQAGKTTVTLTDEAKNLVRMGLATAESNTVAGRRRTVHAITDEGRRRVRDWLATPPSESALESEPLLRLMLMDLGPPGAALEAIERVEADARSMLEVGRVVRREYLEGTAPFQDQIHARALVFDFLTSHADMLLGWCSRARAALETYGERPSTREESALELIRTAMLRIEAEGPVKAAGIKPQQV